VSDVDEVATVPDKPKRGRETAVDMILSLGVVMLLVVVIYVLAQPPSSDEAAVRRIDPSADVTAFTRDQPGAPVPVSVPDDWTPTSSQLIASSDRLRVGYVTAGGRYAEYAASAADPEEVLDEFVAGTSTSEPVDVDGQPWEQYVDEDGSLSLVRSFGGVTVVVGTLRSSATVEELRVLAGALG